MGDVQVVVFDVNETLSDLTPLRSRFADVGAPEAAAAVWFAALLRDGFALAAAGSYAPFHALAEGGLRVLLAGEQLNRRLAEAVAHVMAGFAGLPVHSDVVEGVQRLSDAGLRLVTLSNGSTDVGQQLLQAAGIRDRFERLMSVESPRVWKPAPAAYQYAARTCGVPLDAALLVAVHPWDIDGAARAGMRTAWVNRGGAATYPDYFTPADHTVGALPDLVETLRG